MEVDLSKPISLHRQGRREEAAALYEIARRAAPDDTDILYLLGLCRLEMGEMKDGVRHMRRLVRLQPRNAAAHHALGKGLAALGEGATARRHLETALVINPALVDSTLELALLAQNDGDPARAAALLRAAIVHHPDNGVLWNNLGTACRRLGDTDGACTAWLRAIDLAPRLAGPYCNLATREMRAGYAADSLAIIRQGLAASPDDSELLFYHGCLAFFDGEFSVALEALEKALAHRPDNRPAQVQLAQVRQYLCDWDGLDALMPVLRAEIASAVAGRACQLSPFFAVTLPTSEAERTAVAAAEARKREATLAPQRAAVAFSHARKPKQRLHIGYLSGDWRDHAASHLACGLFRHHDRSAFEVSVLSFGPDDGADYLRRIRGGAEHFVDLHLLSDQDAARTIHDHGVDIVLDVQGFMGNSRPEIFMLRPAPIQISYLTYLGGMGTECLDYIIADATMITPDNRAAFTEAVVTLPNCYQVNDDEARIGAPARHADEGLPDDEIVYCAIHGGHKITRQIFARWMRILERTPGSVLWLAASGRLRETLCNAARRHGIDPETRLVFARRLPDKADHMARLALADLFLDTPIYGAHSSAVDSLWAGTPVLTCPGDVFSSRGAATLLRVMGIEELIAPDYDAYERIAVELAFDPAARQALRARVAARRAESPLFDTAGWVSDVERAYREMWEIYLRGEPARDIILKGSKPA
jgi:protein O-GlcNAc transferase